MLLHSSVFAGSSAFSSFSSGCRTSRRVGLTVVSDDQPGFLSALRGVVSVSLCSYSPIYLYSSPLFLPCNCSLCLTWDERLLVFFEEIKPVFLLLFRTGWPSLKCRPCVFKEFFIP